MLRACSRLSKHGSQPGAPGLDWKGGLSSSLACIRNVTRPTRTTAGYQGLTKARIVRYGVWPYSWGYSSDASACTNLTQTASFTADAPMGVSGVRQNAKLQMEGLYRWAALTAGGSVRGVCVCWGGGCQ
jgi:hypothetical protein